jgi:HSP20 family protein
MVAFGIVRCRRPFAFCGTVKGNEGTLFSERSAIMSTAIARPNRRQMERVLRPFEMFRHDFDDLFGWMNRGWDNNWLTNEFNVPWDLSETADAFQLRMDAPGIKPEDITVQVTGDTVHVMGERKEEKELKEKTYHRMERRSGTFCETVVLPTAVNDEKVEAQFHDGVLTVMLPKAEASKTRTVTVKATGK